MKKRDVLWEVFRRGAIGFPWGAAGVYLLFLLGGLFSLPAPGGVSLAVVSEALAARWGNPATAALVQFLWSGLLGSVLALAGVPFLLERTLLWSGLHFLLTAAAVSLAGWRCGWFPYVETWLCVLGLVLLCWLLMWVVRYVGWRQDLRLLRRAAGLTAPPPSVGTLRPYFLLAACVELVLPWLLRALDAADVPVLAGLFYPFLILPLFCFFSGMAMGRRGLWRWRIGYGVWCALLAVPNVFLLYNYTALFQAWTAGLAALLGAVLGLLRGRREKR